MTTRRLLVCDRCGRQTEQPTLLGFIGLRPKGWTTRDLGLGLEDLCTQCTNAEEPLPAIFDEVTNWLELPPLAEWQKRQIRTWIDKERA